MPTVIDSLLVQIGLDATAFKKGQRDTAESMGKVREEADKTGKTMKGMEKSVGETFESLTRKAITYFAVLAGAKSIEEFTTKLVSQDAALGRLAKTLGVLPQDLSAMTGAVERNGGSAEAAAASFRSLSDSFENIKINGNDGILPMLQKLQGVGGKNIDIFHGFNAALPGIAENLKALKDAGKDVDADFFARSLIGDPETAIALEQGWAKFHADIERYKKENPPDAAWTKQAQELTEGWNDAKRATQGFGRYFVETFSPLMQHEMKLLVDILHGDLTKMLSDWTGILGDIGNLTNSFYHKLTGKWIFDPASGSGAQSGDGYSMPGGGGTGLRGRRGDGSGNDAIRLRGAGSIGRLAQNENAKAWIDELRKAGYNDNVIAASVGSAQTESSFNPRAWNGIKGGHTGAWQWDATRWPKIKSWIEGQGGNPFDYRWQAKAWIAEHNAKPGDAIYDTASTEKAGAIFRSNPTLSGAVHGVRLSERFGPGEEGGRAVNAANWLPHVAAGPVVPPPKPGTELPLFHSNQQPMSIYGDISGAARAFHGTTNNSSAVNNHSSQVSVGEVHVHTKATDGEGIAKSIRPALERRAFVTQANRGPL